MKSTPSEIQSVELFRIAYFEGRRAGMLRLSPTLNPYHELHAAWELGRFSGAVQARSMPAIYPITPAKESVAPLPQSPPSPPPGRKAAEAADPELLAKFRRVPYVARLAY